MICRMTNRRALAAVVLAVDEDPVGLLQVGLLHELELLSCLHPVARTVVVSRA